MSLELRRHAVAAASASRAIALAPSRPWPWALRAIARSELADHERAASDATIALSLPHGASDEVLARRARGQALAAWSDHRGAFDDMTRCVKVDATNPSGRAARAWLDAHPRAADAPPLDKQEATRVFEDARVALGEARWADAEKLLTLVIHSAPAFVEGWGSRGAARAHLDRVEEALPDLDQALDISPEKQNALALRARLHVARNELEPGLADAERCVRRYPRSFEGWLYRGEGRRRAGDLSGALSDSAMVVWLAPWNAEAYLRMGAVLDMQEDVDGARAVFERFVALESLAKAPQPALGMVREWLRTHPPR